MTITTPQGVSRGRSLFVWALFATIAGIIFLIYALASRTAGRGEFVMPLDDVYIHFQYARQIAHGEFYQYNPGLPATSGATSFLYPYLLAIGVLIGFDGLSLGLWAMGLGALMMLGSMWLIYLTGEYVNAPRRFSAAISIIFALTGSVAWHFMSGMETDVMIFVTLLTLYMFISHHFTGSIVAASLLALTRPEGGAMAVIVVAVLFLKHRFTIRNKQWLLLLIPLLASGVQPVVNIIITGSPIASGNQAKSILATVPHNNQIIAEAIIDNFIQMWRELITGVSPREGLYIAFIITIPAFVALFHLLHDKQMRLTGLMIFAWLLSITLLLSTLETAFWHFKRYQMPLMALLFPLTIMAITVTMKRWHTTHAVIYGSLGIAFIIAAITFAQFLQHYALNVNTVYLQPLQMAQWIDTNTPEDAVIAVHDVGLLRYRGNRTTIDIVGLTTPGAAQAWRNGPGAVMEFLQDVQPSPDYIASYGFGHGFGLDYLAATSIYGEPLASFPVVLDDNFNVALAADFQGVYRPDWTTVERGEDILQPSTQQYIDNMALIDVIDVANLESEAAHRYQWRNDTRLPGFPTETFEQPYIDCVLEDCGVLDGGRRINGEESFDIFAEANEDVILVTRVHPQNAGTFDVFANDTHIATRWIPAQAGQWLEIATLIPKGTSSETLHIRIVPHIPDGHYQPYQHWIYQGDYSPESSNDAPVTTLLNGNIVLSDVAMMYDQDSTMLITSLEWHNDGGATGDYIAFVHVYDDVDAPPVAQYDKRPGNGTMSPGNWLPGALTDTITLDLSQLEPGVYQAAIGMYDPMTGERLMPSGGDADGRFFIGEIEVE
ncbi:MAG: hypothetical protein D6737_11370 [Chloroflexi bacterium]|nr:MAG: hypothetical protein D6737_11370 [Chloroflexota bacterium]